MNKTIKSEDDTDTQIDGATIDFACEKNVTAVEKDIDTLLLYVLDKKIRGIFIKADKRK